MVSKKIDAAAYMFLAFLFGVIVAAGWLVQPSKLERIATQEWVIKDLQERPLSPKRRKPPWTGYDYEGRREEIRREEAKLEEIKNSTYIGKNLLLAGFLMFCAAWFIINLLVLLKQ